MSKRDELRRFYQSMSGNIGAMPLEPDSPLYVRLLEESPDKDPILKLATRIDWAESQSVNLLTGFRGNGKSTELRRLRYLLREKGAIVILVDMAKYVLFTKPVEISDFILSLMAALTEQVQQVAEENGWQLEGLNLNYWERLKLFLQSEVKIDSEFGADFGVIDASLGLKLHRDPSFKEKIQTHLRGHIGQLVEDAQRYVVELVAQLRTLSGNPDLKVVLLVDSLEQIRGIGEEQRAVQRSVEELFGNQATNLNFRTLHVVYTIPPYLILNPTHSFPDASIVMWPNIHVRKRCGELDEHGVGLMQQVIETRYPAWQDLCSTEQLWQLASSSGGDLRDFFRLLRDALVATANAERDRIFDATIEQVEMHLLEEITPIAEDDQKWLLRVHNEKEAALSSTDELGRLQRFLDNNLIMNYINGRTWYDVHPLLIPILTAAKNA